MGNRDQVKMGKTARSTMDLNTVNATVSFIVLDKTFFSIVNNIAKKKAT
jgi:hypothetical protein